MPKSDRRPWNRDELIVAFNLYCRTPFGRLHSKNPDIVALSKSIGRTPSALAMKLVNFASLDPAQRTRGVRGLQNASKADQEIWDEFHSSWESLALESQARIDALELPDSLATAVRSAEYKGKTESVAQRRVRLAQGFFRDVVLSNYDNTCAVCCLALPEMLIASHIVPWSVDPSLRVDPTNGMALCAFHDKAFDTGLFTVDDEYTLKLSRRAGLRPICGLQRIGLLDMEGQLIHLPPRFRPDLQALKYHRENIFLGR